MFIVYGKPQGKARARTFYDSRAGKHKSVTPESTVFYENYIKMCFGASGEPKFMNKEPVKVVINAYFGVPSSASKKKQAEMLRQSQRPTKKPDADNIAKVICDALNGVAYVDDTQVVQLIVTKRWTEPENERVEVGVEAV